MTPPPSHICGARRALDRATRFGIVNYSKVAPYGIRGRFVYVNVAARL